MRSRIQQHHSHRNNMTFNLQGTTLSISRITDKFRKTVPSKSTNTNHITETQYLEMDNLISKYTTTALTLADPTLLTMTKNTTRIKISPPDICQKSSFVKNNKQQ